MRTRVALKPKTAQQIGTTLPERRQRRPGREAKADFHLQSAIGNQAVQRNLQHSAGGLGVMTPRPMSHAGVQAKLTVGSPGDTYEQEADSIADRIMRMPETGPGGAVAASAASSGDGKAPASFQTAMSSLAGGQPLPKSERAYFEERFGHSFENVRIHSGTNADAAAASIGARAFTLGSDIAFAQGQYRPGTGEGRRLLAHELTHTLQQSGTSGTSMVQADFWDTVGKGWGLYWRMEDAGTPFARQLMEHYILGFGTDFDVNSGVDQSWNEFMLGRPEIQRALRPVLEGIAARAGSSGPTEQPWLRWGAGPTINETVTGVRLNELESMRLTLHGCHRIDVEVNYDVNAIEGGQEVVFRRISMTWVDRGDMHPGTVTELDNGGEMDDAELTSAGSAYDIFIEFSPQERTVYHVIGGAVTQVSGWPPAGGTAATSGERG